jgi:hypothetical protein
VTNKAAVIALWLTLICACPAFAGETSVYLKSGWFTWDEQVSGSSFVSEDGILYGAGVARKDDVSVVTVAELVEVWGGNVDYDGHALADTTQIHADTSYLGTREEFAVSVKLPAAGSLSVAPVVAIGHKFWVRTRSDEDWNTFYSKAGAAVEFTNRGWSWYGKGGALVPFYTRSHVTLSDSGYSDVVTEPETRVSAFAEGGVRSGAFTVGVEYEGMEFGQSKKVMTSRVASTGSGIVILANQAYQPKSSSRLVSLKLSYSF